MDLPKVKTNNTKRRGRGAGSGKGFHTSGRGMKGQKSRTKVGVLFTGTKMKKSFIKKLPFLRGKGKNKGNVKPVVFNLSDLETFPVNSKVNLDFLVEKGLITKSEAVSRGVKILGEGKLAKKLTVELPASVSAVKKIEKAGGKVVLN